MKHFFTTAAALLLSISMFAQAPQKLSYQCVIRNSSGDLVSSQAVGLRITILQGSSTGTIAYQETYDPSPVTNVNGLLSIEIGSGTPLSGLFSDIDWSAGPYFLKTETDPAGGTSYSIEGTSQLLSVPYALYSETAGNVFSGSYTDLSDTPAIPPDLWSVSGSDIYYNSGSVGIGTSTPRTSLEVNGQILITGGTPGAGQVLTSDGDGLATWEPPAVPVAEYISFEVKKDASYDWPVNGTVRQIDFSSNSTIWRNDGNAFNPGTSTFTAPENGIYAFHGMVCFDGLTTGSLIYAYLRIAGGAKIYEGSWDYATGNNNGAEVFMTLYLAAGETAELWGYVSDPSPPAQVYGNANATYGFTYFTGAKVN